VRGSSFVDLDRWLSDPVLRTHHAREGPASVDALWAAAATVRLGECRILGRLIRRRIPGLPADLTFDELFRSPPFNLLEAGPAYRLSGLCGRIWTVRGDFAPLAAAEDFVTWSTPGTVRVLFANWAEASDAGAALVSEVRVAAVDRRAARYVRALEPFISAFQGLVAAEPLKLAVRRARDSEPGDDQPGGE
jgi:hypothetical protein